MKQEIIMTRIFDAPIENVWKCWTEPEFLMKWWGPDRFTSPKAIIDFQENRISVVWTIEANSVFDDKTNNSTFIYSSKRGFVSIEYKFYNGDKMDMNQWNNK